MDSFKTIGDNVTNLFTTGYNQGMITVTVASKMLGMTGEAAVCRVNSNRHISGCLIGKLTKMGVTAETKLDTVRNTMGLEISSPAWKGFKVS